MWLRASKAMMIVALLLAHSGCAGYRQVPTWGDRAAPPSGGQGSVKAGTRLRVTMHSGEEVYGTLEEFTAAEIVLLQGRGDRATEVRIATRDVRAVHEEHTSVARSVALAVLVAAAAGVGYWANSFATGLGGMN